MHVRHYRYGSTNTPGGVQVHTRCQVVNKHEHVERGTAVILLIPTIVYCQHNVVAAAVQSILLLHAACCQQAQFSGTKSGSMYTRVSSQPVCGGVIVV